MEDRFPRSVGLHMGCQRRSELDLIPVLMFKSLEVWQCHLRRYHLDNQDYLQDQQYRQHLHLNLLNLQTPQIHQECKSDGTAKLIQNRTLRICLKNLKGIWVNGRAPNPCKVSRFKDTYTGVTSESWYYQMENYMELNGVPQAYWVTN